MFHLWQPARRVSVFLDENKIRRQVCNRIILHLIYISIKHTLP